MRADFTRCDAKIWCIENRGDPIPVHASTPVMAYDSWGESPLYENEDLKEGSIPTVTPIEQVRDEGNCGEVTNRGGDFQWERAEVKTTVGCHFCRCTFDLQIAQNTYPV